MGTERESARGLSPGDAAARRFWYKRVVPRRPFLGFLAFLSALVVAFGVPIVRDSLTLGPPTAAVLSARSGPSPSAGADPSGIPTQPDPAPGTGPDTSPATDPGTDGGSDGEIARAARATKLAGMLRTEALHGEGWPTPPGLLTGYRWPLPHGRITQAFGASLGGTLMVDGQLFHDGLDIATFCGDHVVAAHDGLVIAAGRKVDPWMGWIGSLEPSVKHRDARHSWYTLPIILVIDDGNGYRSVYAHFNQVVVRVGQRVKAGQFIGYEGSTGFATGCHVHYGLFDPLETGRMELSPDVAKRTKLPAFEIARINPLLVLPPRPAMMPTPPTPTTPASTSPGEPATP